ncbi:pilin [Candidatus Albibeggiatoa sp. nov. BB20]|uniref:pilin n=1 Tax=Candidatus Albibeggiatoa sp. nov. BB20 TaxID=3162723 RepID=UPI00336579E7
MQQRGFSIVELMIVVGIIGVIATFGLPLYSDYMTRSKVSEPLTLLSGLRQPMAEYHLTWNTWPTIASIGGKTTGLYTSVIESGGPINFDYKGSSQESFYVEATMKPENANIGGKQIRLVYVLESRDWVCTLEGTSDPIPEQYLPASCR